MLQNITFSAEKSHIKQARQRAAAQNTTLNAEFRRWLEQYIVAPQTIAELAALVESFSYARAGQSFTRDEMNER